VARLRGNGHSDRTGSVTRVTSLAERLGYGPDDRLLILSCDDLGECHAANLGAYDALRSGLATTAGLMLPCPWARDAAAEYRGEDVGVRLTLNSELERYRWGPITHAPSLLDGDGGFPRTVDDLWDHADLDEVRKELRAQVERAILWGFDVSHLDSHLSAMWLRPEFFDVYLELAADFGLPLRLSGASSERAIGFPFRRLAAEEGVLFPDHLIGVRAGIGARAVLEDVVGKLRPGVTEIAIHPAIDTPELRALTDQWEARVDDHRVTADPELRAAIDAAGVIRIGYRPLRDLQRAG
jgi:predicted glycoside hydrolase/deacetylase ChbG (UPF0249 family)